MGLCNAIVMLQAVTNIYIYNDECKHQHSVKKCIWGNLPEIWLFWLL